MVTADAIAKFVIAAILISFSILIFSLFTGRYLDIKLIKESYQEYGKAVNLLNVIGGSSEIAMEDSENRPLKLVLDESKIKNLDGKNQELECCNYYDYDYSLEISDMSGDKWYLGFEHDELKRFFDGGKTCGEIEINKPLSRYSIPATISDGTNIDPGVMKMELIKTPLSQLAYYISLACEKEGFEKSFFVYNLEKSSNGIEVKKDTICITSASGAKMCKKISCDVSVSKKQISESQCGIKDCIKDNVCYQTIVKGNGDVTVYVQKDFV